MGIMAIRFFISMFATLIGENKAGYGFVKIHISFLLNLRICSISEEGFNLLDLFHELFKAGNC